MVVVGVPAGWDETRQKLEADIQDLIDEWKQRVEDELDRLVDEIVKIIEEQNLMLVRGAVPGKKGTVLKVRISNRTR